MEKIVYRSKVDWWFFGGCLLILAICCIGMAWWLALIFIGGMSALCFVLIRGCWYDIDGDTLVINNLFQPLKAPIGKIREVKYTRGYLAGAASSFDRLAISFTDRSVLKSSMPIEISPKDRDSFVARLKEINPSIKVVK